MIMKMELVPTMGNGGLTRAMIRIAKTTMVPTMMVTVHEDDDEFNTKPRYG